MNLTGFIPNEDAIPIEMTPTSAMAAELESAGEASLILEGQVRADQIEALEANPNVIKVWSNAPIEPFNFELQEAVETNPTLDLTPMAPGDCPVGTCDCAASVPKGNLNDVARYLGVNQIWARGIRGNGIVVGVVDGGITATGRTLTPGEAPARTINNVIGGWPTTTWGTQGRGWSYHGNMCATDVLGMAPDARLYDLRIAGASSTGTVSNALQAFQWAINQFRANGTPQILTNSWGMYQQSWYADYCTNPEHPFTRKVVEAINTGIIVLFAAGNCGKTCPDGRCSTDNGPGKSIWGANGHPFVMTVGAVNTRSEFIGYSSQGPAALDPYKPDFCSVSHFTGYFNSDNGTSAATPIAAGVVALLKQRNPRLSQFDAKAALKDTATDIAGTGWDANTGSGIINAWRAFNHHRASGTVLPAPSPYVATQFTGTLAPNQTHTWFTWGWPAHWHVLWSMMPTTNAGKVKWQVKVERASDAQATYWITVTNVGSVTTNFEGRYGVMG
ncbi:S8 family peptidase [Haliscomenobacter hydrossis]|nr:S8 family serine peptidase [Haliscomenobacter hydrossis]